MRNDMTESDPVPSPAPAEARRERILEAAIGIFMGYGFARATMDDIARAAEMSRPALYLVFKNKGEIYRAIAGQMFAQSLEAARAVLEGEGPLAGRLVAAIEIAVFAMLDSMNASPHGAEILDLKNTFAADLVADWRATLHRLIGHAIEAEAAASGVNLSARGLVATEMAVGLLDVLEGLKARLAPAEDQRKGLAAQVRMISLALRA